MRETNPKTDVFVRWNMFNIYFIFIFCYLLIFDIQLFNSNIIVYYSHASIRKTVWKNFFF